jgi:hypothetical protein
LTYNDPADQQKYWDFIIGRLNRLTEQDPQKVAELRKITSHYTSDLKRLKLKDHLLYNETKERGMINLLSLTFLILGFPIYLVGKILNFPAYYLAQQVAAKKVKNIEFRASIVFGVGSLLLNIFFLMELLIVWFAWHKWQYLLLYTGIKSACGGLGLLYSPFRKKMAGAFRFSKLKKRDPAQVNLLMKQRTEILAIIGNFE